MYSDLLITVLIVVVLILLILNIIIAIAILKLLKTARRAAHLIEAIIDDLENFSKLFRKITLPLSLTQVIRKIASYLPKDKSK